MKAHKDNPYQGKDGLPVTGQLHKFFQFERANQLERRKSLPPEEVQELERIDQHLAKKMNS